jgi:tetratricopeptide (TPR) repeat protein
MCVFGDSLSKEHSSDYLYREVFHMSDDLNDHAIKLVQEGYYAQAIPFFHKAIEKEPLHWNHWYLLGQCYRFANDLENALICLKRAAALNTDDPSIFLALGIALQLTNHLNEAVEKFHKAIDLDPDFDLAYNSLALTQEKQGDLDLAIDTFDFGAKALTRKIIKNMRNDRSNKILKHFSIEHENWIKYCIFGATHLCTLTVNIEMMAWPTGDQAMEEERTESHGGLYWVDHYNSEGKMTRLFLPNYFNTFRETLHKDRTYADLIGNRGTILEQIGRHKEANEHFAEAEYFLP